MSQLVFPTFSTARNGAMGWPVKKTPVFRTIIQTPASLRGENRISLTPYPIWRFEIPFEILRGDFSSAQSASYLQSLVGFFGQVQGAWQDWLFTDPYDNTYPSTAPMQFGTGDGVTTKFQLQRTINGMEDLIQNLNGTPTIFVNGTPTTPASISSTGLVTFSSAPANLAALTWYGSFYFRCRFDEDEWDELSEFVYQLWELPSLKFRSVIL